jgi:serine/threonine protein kinase
MVCVSTTNSFENLAQFIDNHLENLVRRTEAHYHVGNLQQFAEGESGRVYVGHLIQTKETVAVKKIPFTATAKMETIANEIMLMRESRHPNIVPLLDCFVDSHYLYVSLQAI